MGITGLARFGSGSTAALTRRPDAASVLVSRPNPVHHHPRRTANDTTGLDHRADYDADGHPISDPDIAADIAVDIAGARHDLVDAVCG